MFNTSIEVGYLFYAKTKRRKEILITSDLKEQIKSLTIEMYNQYNLAIVPIESKKPCCKSCSLLNICNPNIFKNSVSKYIDESISHFN